MWNTKLFMNNQVMGQELNYNLELMEKQNVMTPV